MPKSRVVVGVVLECRESKKEDSSNSRLHTVSYFETNPGVLLGVVADGRQGVIKRDLQGTKALVQYR